MVFAVSTRFSGLLLCLWALMGSVAAQTPAAPTAGATAAPRRQLAALHITQAPKLDGVLDEAVWREAPLTSQFTQQQPKPGVPEKHPTEVRVLYDDAAIYVGATMHDVSPDSIPRELTARDNTGNSDYFGIFLDTYSDHLNGYGFLVTSSGVQLDSRYSPAGGEDFNWNAVWESQTTLRGTDWVAEIRIPFSAIRFSTAEVQQWGLNFMRQRKRENQQLFWNEVKPEVDGFVNQWGILTGVKGVKPPLRLSLTPYVSGYVNHNPLNTAGTKRTTSFNGGADVKWGINESFTLDATLVPDFGQVQSDNQVLNLSPFEVQFNENRQFFTEGTELFNKGDLFYSRRVGATPIGFYDVTAGPNERLLNNPAETPLLNATKVSGRTSKGLGIGVFNAVSSDVYATIRNTQSDHERKVLTQPRTNYNIVVLDQSLKNNSYVSFVNTNVLRQGRTYDATVTGGLLHLANKQNAYALDVRGFYSLRRGQEFSADPTQEGARVADPNGYKYFLSYGKISGNFTWNIDHGVESDAYNPNDLGILFSNNSLNQSANVNYGIYKPFWKLNRLNLYAGYNLNYLYRPTLYADNSLYLGMKTQLTKSFLSLGFNMNGPLTAGNDYFEPRKEALGRYFVQVPRSWGGGPYLSTDSRKALAVDASAWVRASANDEALGRTGRMLYELSLSPRWRVNNQLNFRYEANFSTQRNNIGYVNGGLDFQEPADVAVLTELGYLDRGGLRYGQRDGDVLLGRRHVNTLSNTLSAGYTFTNRMSFTIRGRHYVSNVHYRDFSRLRPGGEETPVAYARNRDNTYNAFTIDAVYSWWFAPGSQISVVWKNAGSTYLQANEATPQFFDNFNNTINTPHNNSLSVRVLYYLDYLALRKKRGR